MTDITDPTVERLRAGLNTAAASVGVRPGLRTAIDRRRQRRVRRRRAGAAIAAAGALTAGVAIALTLPSGTARVVVGSPAAPATGTTVARDPTGAAPIGPPWWLPTAGTARRIEVNNNTTGPAYQQLYLGSGSVNPAELLIVTVETRPGGPSSPYVPTGTVHGETTVHVGSVTAHLADGGGAEQLWWTEPDGVGVVASATGLTPTQLVGLMSGATPLAGSALGMSLPSALPAGLAPARAAMSTHTGWVEDVQIAVGSCRAELDIYQGVPYLISTQGGTTTRTTLRGTPALLESVPGVGTTLFWSNAPGLTAVLMSNGAGGPGCAAPLLAPGVHRATSAEWAAETAALGGQYHQDRPVPSFPTTTTAVVGANG